MYYSISRSYVSCSNVNIGTIFCGVRFDSGFLMSSSNPLSTDLSNLLLQYNSNAVGVNTRTSLLAGFQHDDNIHKWSFHSGGTVNCYGYSPYPFETYLGHLRSLKKVSEEQKQYKPFFISITGTPKDLFLMITTLSQQKESLSSNQYPLFVEINLSCPNIPNKPLVSYDPSAIDELLSHLQLNRKELRSLKIGVKLAPYLNDYQFIETANVLNKHSLDFVTSINTVGNGLVIDTNSESSVIGKTTYGGLGGTCVHNVALGNIRKLRLLLKDSIDLVGVGGVHNGETAFSHILCGASLVQVATQFLKEGPSCFERIQNELTQLMSSKGYKNIEDFKGKLKE